MGIETMRTQALRTFSLHAAGALMALMAITCLAVAGAVGTAVGGALTLPVAALAAGVTFQALRVPVGRAAAWLLDR
jgi:hypothetical protein